MTNKVNCKWKARAMMEKLSLTYQDVADMMKLSKQCFYNRMKKGFSQSEIKELEIILKMNEGDLG